MKYQAYGHHKLGTRPLDLGSSGDDVKNLQELLGVTVDGLYGPKTDDAFRAIPGNTSKDRNTYLGINTKY